MQEECENLVEVGEGPSICLDKEPHRERHAAAVLETAAYGIKAWVKRDFDDAIAATKKALGQEGFGVLTEINVRDMFHQKLNLSFPRYTILGVCNPEYAHQALDLDRDFGLLLPCNVVVYEQGEGSVVEAIDPIAQLAVTGNKDLQDVAVTVKEKLQDVIDHVASGVV